MFVIYLRDEVCENEKRSGNTHNTNSNIDIFPSTSEWRYTGSEVYTPILNSGFTCEVCDKTFEEKRDLQRHYSFHIVGKPFVCKKCDSTFMRESALTMHRCPAAILPVKAHPEVPKQRISVQTETVKPRNEKPYICEVCNVKFMSKSNLKFHLKENKCITKFNCSICRCNFKQLSSLARHHNKIHLGVDLKDEPEDNKQDFQQPDLPHTCEVCGKKFSKKLYLIEHLPVHKDEEGLTEFKESLEKEEISVAKVQKNELSKKPANCEICGQKFSKRYDILRHMSTHTGEKAYQCDVCKKRYISKATLLVHKRRFHSSIRPFACDLCPKAFLKKPELDSHYFIHKENKPFTCGNCKSGFCHRNSLERHIKMQSCVGGPPLSDSLENADDMKDDDSMEESNALNSPENSSDSDYVSFILPSPQSEVRRTRSRTASIANLKSNLKAFSKMTKDTNRDLASQKFEHLSGNQSSASRKVKESSGEEQATIQQYFPSQCKRSHTSNILDNQINHPNLLSSANSGAISSDDEPSIFTCTVCYETFQSRRGLIRHSSLHKQENKTLQESKKNPSPFGCSICGERFRLKRDLVAHSKVHDTVKDFICVDCNLSFKEESHFTSHACKDSKFKMTGLTSEKSSNDHTKKNNHFNVYQDDDLFVCSLCSKSFKLEKDLKCHLASHALNKGFFCDFCPKAFYLEKDLNTHVLTHSKKKIFTCKMCQEDFDLLKDLSSHLLTHWSSGFVCKHCHEGFATEEDLKKHVDSCPSKSNFICNVCEKSFLLKCALVSHAKTHQKVLENKQFTCKLCGRTFLRNLYLRQHLGSHSGEKLHFCEVCGKGYFLKASLRAHVKYHNGNRPYACDRCDKKYVCKRDLDIHYLKHTVGGVASYICNECGQGFCLKKGLEEHLMTEHGNPFRKGTKKKQGISPD